jgi:ankyrin repeat protein
MDRYGETDIDFAAPFKRVDFISELEERAGITIPVPYDSEVCRLFLDRICSERKVRVQL